MYTLDEPMVHSAESFSSKQISLLSLSLRAGSLGTTLATSKHIFTYIYIYPGQFICFKNNHICNFLCLDQGSRTQKLSVKEQDRIYLEEFLGLTKMFLRSLRTNLLPTLSLTKMDGSLIFLLSNETCFNLLLPNYFLLLLDRILLCLIFFIQCYFCGHTTIYL